MIVNELDKPTGEIIGEGLLSILEGNNSFNKDLRGNLQEYGKVKQKHQSFFFIKSLNVINLYPFVHSNPHINIYLLNEIDCVLQLSNTKLK